MISDAEKLSLLLEALKKKSRYAETLAIRDALYPEQDRFVMDDARFLAACTTRRAGKSNGLGLRFFRTLERHPGSFCPYIALTRESAKNIMWDVLQEQDEKFKIGAKFTLSNLTVTVPRFNDARIQLFGADMKNFIKRLRGIKTPGVGVDEAQDFGSHLESLIDDVLTPATSDYRDGWIGLTGTPGPIPHGYFFQVTKEKKFGYSLHSWSLFNNPYLPNPRQFVEELKAKKGWASDHPTLLREYYGEWVLDLDAIVFKYKKERNDYRDLPLSGKGFDYVIGVDIGFHDSDAIAVIGWHPKKKEAYLVHEEIASQQGVTELAETLLKLVKRYAPLKIVMDTGGLGKKIAEEIRRRYQIPVEAAEKTRKFEYVEILNDALLTKSFFARSDSRFAEDSLRVKWDTESTLLKISDSFHSDICDAVLYGYREALNWLSEPELVRPEVGSKAHFEKLEEEMEEAALANYEKSENAWGDEWNLGE